jgi:hypothetical protein
MLSIVIKNVKTVDQDHIRRMCVIVVVHVHNDGVTIPTAVAEFFI